MGLHVVVGAGVIGSQVARTLSWQGHQVKIVTRSGSGPDGDGIERVSADAADAAALAKLTGGAAVLYNCANPPYHRWPQLWPPIAAALLEAAERNDAVLVTVANLYGYGPARTSIGQAGYDAAHPMTESTPQAATGRKGMVRVGMWRDALAAHEAGRVRAVEVRASDYVGAGAQSVLGDRVVPNVLRGKAVSVLGRTDRAHTWTYTGDVAELAVRAGLEPSAWGKAWHAPSGPAKTQREAIDDIAAAAGVSPVPVRTIPKAVLRLAGLAVPLMRELTETEYQFSQDFVMDSAAAQQAFGLAPTAWDVVLTELVGSFGQVTRPGR
jgi:nucleoside-diphosphate-sugar epimerase